MSSQWFPPDDFGTYRTPQECAAIEKARDSRKWQESASVIGGAEKRDWTYSAGCGCQVTFFAESEYYTSRMTPGSACAEHTRRDQIDARDSLIAYAKEKLAEFRHETETVRRYLMVREFVGTGPLYAIIDGEQSSGYMSLRMAITNARERFGGPYVLPVWNADAKKWESELTCDASL